jgi:small-conductance mechanosensitive channel
MNTLQSQAFFQSQAFLETILAYGSVICTMARLVPFCLLALTLCLSGSARAQTSVSAAPAAGPVLLAPASAAPVEMNNQILFSVHTFGDQNAQDRADLANLRLAEALRELFTARASDKAPQAAVGSQQGQTVLLLDGKLLLTVTQADADAANKPIALLAQNWADSLNKAFEQARRERQPAFLRSAFERAGLVLLFGIVITLVLWIVVRRFGHHPGWPVQTLLWLVVVREIVNLFPQSRPYYLDLITGPLRPLVLCVIVGLPAAILVRLWGIILRRLFPPIPKDLSVQDRTERTYQRRVTLARVAEVTGTTILWVLAGFVVVSSIGLNLSALLASAGLIGVAISLVAQDSLKDLVAGIYILADDRFGVGDTVQTGVYTGKVEKLNLRATQLRDSAGRLITISNRNIVEVANLTARWAQVDFRIGVSYYSDLAAAQKLLEDTAKALAGEWSERVLAPPEMLGVDEFTDQSIMLRLTIRTPPGDQWAVGRELRARVKAAFDAAGIVILNSLYTPPPAPDATPHSSPALTPMPDGAVTPDSTPAPPIAPGSPMP